MTNPKMKLTDEDLDEKGRVATFFKLVEAVYAEGQNNAEVARKSIDN